VKSPSARPNSVGKGKKQAGSLFAYGLLSTRLNRATPSINGYCGGFGYNLANGLIIVVGATKSEIATTDASVFDILRDITKYVSPRHQLIFEAAQRRAVRRPFRLSRA